MKPSLTLGPCTYPSPSKVFSHPCDDNSEEKEKNKKEVEEEKEEGEEEGWEGKEVTLFPTCICKVTL